MNFVISFVLQRIGGFAGKYIGDRVEPTSLPQTVAAFHSLVGVAASAAAIGDYSNAPVTSELDKIHLASVYLATVIGSVTCTGSLVAFGKLDGRMSSSPMQHPARDQINMGLGAGMRIVLSFRLSIQLFKLILIVPFFIYLL